MNPYDIYSHTIATHDVCNINLSIAIFAAYDNCIRDDILVVTSHIARSCYIMYPKVCKAFRMLIDSSLHGDKLSEQELLSTIGCDYIIMQLAFFYTKDVTRD